MPSCKVDLYFSDLHFNDFTLYFSFRIYSLKVAVKLVSLQPYGRKYLLLKSQTYALFQSFTAYNYSCQALAALQNLDPAENCKTYTCIAL